MAEGSTVNKERKNQHPPKTREEEGEGPLKRERRIAAPREGAGEGSTTQSTDQGEREEAGEGEKEEGNSTRSRGAKQPLFPPPTVVWCLWQLRVSDVSVPDC